MIELDRAVKVTDLGKRLAMERPWRFMESGLTGRKISGAFRVIPIISIIDFRNSRAKMKV